MRISDWSSDVCSSDLIDGAGLRTAEGHQPDQALDQIAYIAEGARLRAVTVDGYGLAGQRLHDHVRDDAAVAGREPRPVSVEDAGDPHLATAHSSVIERQSFSRPLALVVTRARPDRIDAAAIILALGVDFGIAVDFAGRGQEKAGAQPFGQLQQLPGADHAGEQGDRKSTRLNSSH